VTQLSANARREIARLTRLATDARFAPDERAAALLTAHQRRDAGSCLCSWAELGKSHALHQAEVLADAGLLAARDCPDPAETLRSAYWKLRGHASSYRSTDVFARRLASYRADPDNAVFARGATRDEWYARGIEAAADDLVELLELEFDAGVDPDEPQPAAAPAPEAGAGHHTQDGEQSCPICYGSGTYFSEETGDYGGEIVACVTCRGSGRLDHAQDAREGAYLCDGIATGDQGQPWAECGATTLHDPHPLLAGHARPAAEPTEEP
jgi:hypothetical protein